MGQTLTHGVYLPDEGERNCYSGLAANWQILDTSVGTIAEHTSALSGKAPLVHTHTKADITDLFNSANTWSENNKFSKAVSPSDITGIDSNTMSFAGLRSVIFFNTTGSSNRQSYGTFLYSGYTAGSKPDNYGQLQLLRSTDKKGETNNGLIPDTSFAMWRVAPHYLIMDFMNNVRVTNDGTENSLKPITNNATDLGTSDNKWKTLNGINPGALSLPSNSYTTIDTTDWDLTCSNGQLGSFTPTADGWLILQVNNSGSNEVNLWIIGGVIRINNKSTINTVNNGNFNMITTPVEKDKTYNIYGNASEYVAGRTIGYCRFIPCLGNV